MPTCAPLIFRVFRIMDCFHLVIVFLTWIQQSAVTHFYVTVFGSDRQWKVPRHKDLFVPWIFVGLCLKRSFQLHSHVANVWKSCLKSCPRSRSIPCSHNSSVNNGLMILDVCIHARMWRCGAVQPFAPRGQTAQLVDVWMYACARGSDDNHINKRATLMNAI
jgi:hypothetical protein